MNQKTKYILAFPSVALRNLSKLLKNLLNFTEVNSAKQHVEKMGFHQGLPVIDLADVAPNLNEEIKSFTFLDGTSRVIDIALLKALAKRFSGCEYLEIGSWRGESILNVAPHCRQCTSLSLSKDEMRKFNFSEAAIGLDGFLINSIPNLKLIAHNSLTFNFDSLQQKFDLIFVDGDHSHDAVLSDTRNVFKLLRDERSIIVWHDCGNFYEDQRWEVIAGILDGATQEQRKHIYRISNTLCGIYILGDFNTTHRSPPHTPSYVFDVSINHRSI